MNNMKEVSKQIKMLRIERGWTQKKLANKIQVSQATVCRAEISCNNIKWKTIIQIFNALKKNQLQNIETNLFVKEEELFTFIQELKKNEKIWAIINYDPKKTAKLFAETIEKVFKFEK